MKLYRLYIKNIFDLAASFIGFIFFAPLLVAIAVIIRIFDGRPVFFLQERMGRNFQPFKLIKFRTMVVGASAKGAAVTKGEDPRITKIGKFLRQYKLDELPQLINVLKGDMSLVGPRPEMERYVAAFRDDYRTILSIKPGITDYATLEYRDEEKVLNRYDDVEAGYIQEVLPAKIVLYKRYIREMSFLTDIKIILKTLWKIVT